jgi:DNA-binding Lrp family transcriptional regulator
MKAYVLVETNAGKTKSVKKTLAKLKPGKCRIESLDAVTGPFDYIAVVQGPTLDDIGQLVTEGIGSIDGVTRTTTCLAVSIG